MLLGSTVATLATRNVVDIISKTYWCDELWVAIAARVDLSQFLLVNSSSPPLWALLVRSVNAAFGEQYGRLVALAFAILATTVAFYLGKQNAKVHPLLTGSLTALAVCWSPFLLERTDMKQYTADAFITLLVALLAMRFFRSKSWADLVWLTVVSFFSLGFSTGSIFVVASVWLVGIFLTRGYWRLYLPAMVTSVIGVSATYLLFFRAARNEEIVNYWNDFYPSLARLPRYVLKNIENLIGEPVDGSATPYVIWFSVAFAIAVLFALVKRDFVFLAIVGVSIFATLAAGVLRFYPLLDLRTSTYIVVLLIAFTCTYLVQALFAILAKLRFAKLAAVITVLAVLSPTVAYASGSFYSPVRTQQSREAIAIMLGQLKPNDIVITNSVGAIALAYYSDRFDFNLEPDDTTTIRFKITFEPKTRIKVVSPGIDLADVQGLELKSDSKVWLFFTHTPMQLSPELAGIFASGIELSQRNEYLSKVTVEELLNR